MEKARVMMILHLDPLGTIAGDQTRELRNAQGDLGNPVPTARDMSGGTF